jgi:hypothetical protein
MTSASPQTGRFAPVWGATLVLTLCILVGWVGVAQADPLRANRVEGVKAFDLDHDSGSMALHALQSALGACGCETGYQRLMRVSGAAFKFVYDSTAAYEPLRDLYPMDVLTGASKGLGFDDAHWVTDEPIETVKAVIKREIDSGRPVLAPFLKPDAYHGFFVVTGYDYGQGLFYLQSAFEGDSGYVTVPIPEVWDGPTVSPAGWATNPIFVIGERKRSGQEIPMAEKEQVELAVSVMKGGRLTYGTKPSEYPYMARPGPHEALYGLPAYDLLSHDIENRELIKTKDGEATLDFAFIWRIDSQVGQLEHDRRNSGHLSMLVSLELPREDGAGMGEARQSLDATADDAGELRRFFWHELPDTIEAGDVAAYVRASSSIVFKLPDDEHLRDRLRAEGFDIFNTVWGWVLIDDSRAKRMLAKTELRSIVVREQRTLEILDGIVDRVGSVPSAKRPGNRTRHWPRN